MWQLATYNNKHNTNTKCRLKVVFFNAYQNLTGRGC